MYKIWIGFSLLLFTFACSNRNTPDRVAEDFVYNYYRQANQEAALSLTEELAKEKLKEEIELLREVRRGSEENVHPQIKYEQVGKKVESENRVVFRFQLTVKNTSLSTVIRNTVILTESIDGRWKVINFDEYGE